MRTLTASVRIGAASTVLAVMLLGCAAPTQEVEAPTEAPTTVPTEPAVQEQQPTPLETPQQVPTADASTQGPAATAPVEIQADVLLQDRCASCHGLDRITSLSKTHDGWAETVMRMVAKGAILDEPETTALIEYLVENYGE